MCLVATSAIQDPGDCGKRGPRDASAHGYRTVPQCLVEPIVLVPKPDGLVWFCVDYREVNKIATFDTYPMPQADILRGQLGQARFLSANDLTGYW